MNHDQMLALKGMHIAPYIQLATALIGKPRKGGGNMFRHQIDTMGILIDYGFIDPILLKASVIHDLMEDVPGFEPGRILAVDAESDQVYALVLEVTRRALETKEAFLDRVRFCGSHRARVLKCADRISNMISLGYVTDVDFVRRYTEETERHIYPIAAEVNPHMLNELRTLVESRRSCLCPRP